MLHDINTENVPRVLELHRDDDVSILEIGPLAVAIWIGAVTPASFRWQQEGLGEIVARHPAGIAFLCLIEPSTRPPNAEMRQASIDMYRKYAESIRCVAFVVTGEGFRTGLHRSVLSALALLNPRTSPSAAFSTADEALKWIDRHVIIRWYSATLRRIDQERVLLAPVL